MSKVQIAQAAYKGIGADLQTDRAIEVCLYQQGVEKRQGAPPILVRINANRRQHLEVAARRSRASCRPPGGFARRRIAPGLWTLSTTSKAGTSSLPDRPL